MIYRQRWEAIEEEILSPQATLSRQSKGRLRKEPPCQIRTAFQRDRDRIVHAKSFRRLKHKTQVFISPEGDHFRTRLTHTLEVGQISRTIGRALRLNEDLIEAIALGHDLGHTPFGHAGEAVLTRILEGGFRHNEQSLRIVDLLENAGRGLNLTAEVRDGILCHTGEDKPRTAEGMVVRMADRIAYVNHDIDDAVRAKIICREDLPKEAVSLLGESHRARINSMVTDMIESSEKNGDISMTQPVAAAVLALRGFLFDKVYVGSLAKEEDVKVETLISHLYDFYTENPQALPEEFRHDRDDKKRRVVDYISGMTDSYAIQTYQRLFVPKGYGS